MFDQSSPVHPVSEPWGPERDTAAAAGVLAEHYFLFLILDEVVPTRFHLTQFPRVSSFQCLPNMAG